MNNQPKFENVAIDLETLDTKPSAKILSIGVVPFNWGEDVSFQELCERPSSLYIKIDLSSYHDAFTESKSTREWWEKQGEEARFVLEPLSSDVNIVHALGSLCSHLDTWVQPLAKDGGQVFCRGYDFDGGILNHALAEYSFASPWSYNRFRCIRTVIDTLADTRNGYVREANPVGFIKHHALHDAAKDAITMLNLKNELTR
ncbi:3'-5' exoribonuclease domain-containing protein [Vibrio parahaemolyticus]|uniref:3'-5' exoribonuclease domain-containing protein n=1 Tax=Vibrio parahaemolyticus TaxID=670 RepID=UPI0004DF80A0|nr:3'-5' exoribonuclease [Vibrio parahaemolyticus]